MTLNLIIIVGYIALYLGIYRLIKLFYEHGKIPRDDIVDQLIVQLMYICAAVGILILTRLEWFQLLIPHWGFR